MAIENDGDGMSETWEWFVLTLALGLVWPTVGCWVLNRIGGSFRRRNQ